MPWFVLLAMAMVVIPSVALTVDHFRRRGFPRLPKLRLPSFGRGPADVPAEFARQVAKIVSEGGFEKVHFEQKPHVDSFPRQYACPHCGGRTRYPWSHSKARGLLGDITELACQIGQKKFCLRCLEQLSDIAAVERKHLKELGKKDPRTLPRKVGRIRVPSFAQLGAIAFAATAFFSVFLSEVRVGGLRIEMWSLFASFALFALGISLKVLGALFRRSGLPLVMIISFVVIMLAGSVAR